MLLNSLQWKFDATILYSLFEWNGCYSRLSVFATTKWFLNTWLVLWKILDAVLVCYAAIIPKPTMLPFRCLLPFVSTYLCEQGWILVEVNEKQSPRVPLFSEIPRVYPYTLWEFCTKLLPGLFQSSTEFILKWPNTLSQVGHNVKKGRVVNTAFKSFNTVATSPLTLSWMRGSPRTECARRKTPYICGANKQY